MGILIFAETFVELLQHAERVIAIFDLLTSLRAKLGIDVFEVVLQVKVGEVTTVAGRFVQE